MADTKLTPDGLPVHRFRTLFGDLSGMAPNQLRLPRAMAKASCPSSPRQPRPGIGPSNCSE